MIIMMNEMKKAIQITLKIAHPRTGSSQNNMKAIQMTARKMARAIHT